MAPPDVRDDLRDLLNEWDPIGVAELVQDEYDCMLTPILTRLKRGADRAELRDFLHHELTDHFGLPAPHDADDVAARLTAWWTSTHPQV
ncbi:hypothetical protein OG785_23445 [Streptomyces sp. NBC_00006]|uniref:hypothetical protein n=1 Tax=unclassified Streptomyces TaxID=2593676 RepID=UPI0022564030|nr:MULTISPECIES: hypothetical protein [unclassified Streptomyces]MCX5533495.1 hypothetical protein [Streptomyces sp. NBC_00006]